MLILKRPWTQQPQTLPRIDWSNPVTRGLEFCAVPVGNTFVDLVTGVVGTRGGTPTRKIATLNGGYATTPWAATIERAGASDSVVWPASATLRGGSLTASNAGTLLALAGSAQADGNEYSVLGTTETLNLGDGPCLAIHSYSYEAKRGNVEARRFQGWVGMSSEAGGLGTSFGNKLHFFGYAYGSSSTSWFAQGAETTVGYVPSFGSTTVSRQAWVLKHDSATSGAAGAYVALGLIWARKLTVDEYARLYRNPWSLFVPRRIWVPVSVGGGADGSITITGTGTTAHAGMLAATGAAAVTLAGAGTTATAGSVTASASSDATAVVTGAGTTASAGTLAATGAAAVTLSGAATSSTAGTLAATGAAAVTLTGAVATAAAGTLSASASGDAAATVTGASTTAAAGTLAATGAAAVTLTGAAVTASAGTVSASAGTNAAVTLTGASVSAAVGALAATGAAQITVTGVQVSASAGTLSAVGQQHGAVTLTGAAAIAACGTLTAFGGDVVREYVRADSAITRTVAGTSAIVPASAGSSAVARSVTLTSRIDAEGTA